MNDNSFIPLPLIIRNIYYLNSEQNGFLKGEAIIYLELR